MAYDLVIKNGTVVDGTGASALPGRCRDRQRQGGRDRPGDGGGQAHHRRARAGGDARLRRSAHALRRADLLGRRGHALVLAWRHHGGDGQLRRRHRALQARDARDRHARPGERRGHPVRRAEQGHHLGLGDLSGVHGRRRGAQAVAQPRLHRAADAVPPLRDGRRLDRARGQSGGDPQDRVADRRGDGCGRARVFVDHAQPAPGLRGQAAGLPQRQPRGAQGLFQPAQEARQGGDRDRADPPGRRARGRPVRTAGFPADRERPAGDLHRPVRSRRHSRGGARHPAPRGAADRQGRAGRRPRRCR